MRKKNVFSVLSASVCVLASCAFIGCTKAETPGQQDEYAISLNKTSLQMVEYDAYDLTATLTKNGEILTETVVWNSSDDSVVAVENGTVSALAAGKATVSAVWGELMANCEVNVAKYYDPEWSVALSDNALSLYKTESEAESVTLDLSSLELAVGGTARLTATVKPDEATVKTVQWSSSDDSVATVAADGTVTAVREGTATITAKCGEKSADCAVTVKAAPVSPTSVTLDQNKLSLTVGNTAQLTATVAPENAADKTVSWSCDNLSVAEVSADGAVTAKAAGTATITVTTTDGSLTATCTVTVSS